ncbi:MAG: MmcQ/YjbR family DNA-binding protein [Pseudomonadota bacterium]
MTRDQFNAFCAALPASTHVVQWGGSDVWKVGGKVYALCGWNDGQDAFTFKVSDMAFEILGDMPGLRPAPYMASRGLKWIQNYAAPGLPDTELKAHIQASYDMIVAKLPKKTRAALAL